jgi:hypothetical protein
MIRSRFLYAILICTVMAGCASIYDAGGPRRPDGTLFESNAEYLGRIMAYLQRRQVRPLARSPTWTSRMAFAI